MNWLINLLKWSAFNFIYFSKYELYRIQNICVKGVSTRFVSPDDFSSVDIVSSYLTATGPDLIISALRWGRWRQTGQQVFSNYCLEGSI